MSYIIYFTALLALFSIVHEPESAKSRPSVHEVKGTDSLPPQKLPRKQEWRAVLPEAMESVRKRK